MMKRLPVRSVPVPVESGSAIAFGRLEVLTHSFHHLGVSGRARRILTEQVCTLMPRDPFSLPFASGLALSHFLDKGVIRPPIVLFAKKLRDDDYIVVSHGFRIPARSRNGDHPHARTVGPLREHVAGDYLWLVLVMRELAVVAIGAPTESEVAAWTLLGSSSHGRSESCVLHRSLAGPRHHDGDMRLLRRLRLTGKPAADHLPAHQH
mmetsp:Transcript_32483/g.75055  ORF Transcript_32483/g.75055 Transcript_32483/m.75055 type:complete len:207 (+) Transcript_32483:558-1178(+)